MQSRKACNPVISSRNMFGLTDLGDVEGRKKRMRGMLEMTTISHGEEVEDDTEIVANFTDFDDNVCEYSEEESGNGEESEEGTDSDEEEFYANPNIACSDSESDVDEEDMDEETEDFESKVVLISVFQLTNFCKILRNTNQRVLILKSFKRNTVLPSNFVVFCDKPRLLWQRMI